MKASEETSRVPQAEGFSTEKILEQLSEGIILLRGGCRLLFMNQRASTILGEHSDIDTHINRFFPGVCVDTLSESRGGIQVETKNKIILVQCRWIEPELACLILEDITAQKETEDMLYCTSAILDQVDLGIITSNKKGEVEFFNNFLEKVEGRRREEVIGKSLQEVYHVTEDTSEQLTVWRTGKSLENISLNYVINSKKINVLSTTYPIYRDGQLVKVASISRNVTELHRLLEKTVELYHDKTMQPGSNGTVFHFSDIIGNCQAVRDAVSLSVKATLSQAPVLIYGETGTGKELFAQSIHNGSRTREYPFVAINCSAIPEQLLESLLFGSVKGAYTGAENTTGLLEKAGSGTLFLDEVNTMSMTLQAKILRVLQEKCVRPVGSTAVKSVSCRFMSATNEMPEDCIRKGTMRQDLYYRLNVIFICIPPLRQRKEDVYQLLQHFIEKYRKIYGRTEIAFSQEYVEILKNYRWPGNIREFEHAVESSIIMLGEEDTLQMKHLPMQLQTQYWRSVNNQYIVTSKQYKGNFFEMMKEFEKTFLQEMLRKHEGNVSKTARTLGMTRQNLQYRIKKLNIRL